MLWKLVINLGILWLAVEIAKRSTFWGALVIALPLTSILAMTWLYWDTHDSERVNQFAREIFLLVPSSLVFFIPFLFAGRTQWAFWMNFALGLLGMIAAVAAMRFMLK